MNRTAILQRLDQLREAVEAGDVETLALVAVGESLTVAIAGTMPDIATANGAALALVAHIHQLVETVSPGADLDVIASAGYTEDEDEEPRVLS